MDNAQPIEQPKEKVYHIATMEIDCINKALKKYNGHRGLASHVLGISERNLYLKIKKYNIKNANMTKYVLGFIFSEDSKHVLLIRKVKPKWQSGKLNGLGGKIEKGEDKYHAMTREFQEETGIETLPFDWRLFAKITDNWNYEVEVLKMFSDRLYEAKTMPHDNHESEVVGVYEIAKLKEENTIANVYWMIHLALDENPEFTTINYSVQ